MQVHATLDLVLVKNNLHSQEPASRSSPMMVLCPVLKLYGPRDFGSWLFGCIDTTELFVFPDYILWPADISIICAAGWLPRDGAKMWWPLLKLYHAIWGLGRALLAVLTPKLLVVQRRKMQQMLQAFW